jgi:hypothetical protein
MRHPAWKTHRFFETANNEIFHRKFASMVITVSSKSGVKNRPSKSDGG